MLQRQIKIYFSIHNSRANQSGTVPVFCYVKITGYKTRFPFSTRVWVLPEHWHNTENRQEHGGAKYINFEGMERPAGFQYITGGEQQQEQNRVLNSISDSLRLCFYYLTGAGIDCSPCEVVAEFRKRTTVAKGEPTFREVAEPWLKERNKRADLSDGTKKRGTGIINILSAHFGNKPARNITAAEIADVLKIPGHRYSYNFKLFQWAKMVFAYGQRAGLLPFDHSAGLKVKRPDHSGNKVHLTAYELETISTAPLVGALARTRDCFVFQCLTGISYEQLQKISAANVATVAGRVWLRGERSKTNKGFSTLLTPEALQILEKYGYQLRPGSNVFYNKNLKSLALVCGIEKNIHSHMARKTFAQIWLERGASPGLVSAMLGNTVPVLLHHYGTVNEHNLNQQLKAINF